MFFLPTIVVSLVISHAFAISPRPVSLTWSNATAEPSQNTKGAIIGGGMPIGNGELVALVFPLAPGTPYSLNLTDFKLPSGVSFFVNMATAMASDTSQFCLGMVSLQTEPGLFSGSSTEFSQTLDTADASVTIATDVASIKIWTDAHTNSMYAKASSTSGKPIGLTVRVQSVHPSTNFSYGGGFGFKDPSSTPDSFSTDHESHVVVISHRNLDSDNPAAFNDTLVQQGLAHLIPKLQGSDQWRHRQFGMRISGDALAIVNDSALASRSPSVEVDVRISAHSNQTNTSAEFHAQLAALHAKQLRTPLQAAYSLHAAWWLSFWNRSYILVSSANAAEESAVSTLSRQYALTRYVQAVQCRDSHWVPIKFNGMLFSAELPPETNKSGPTYRDWGANEWWQNTRLPYGPMLAAGDFDTFVNVLEYFLQTVNFAKARTMEYFGHSGIYYTETKTLFGSYSPRDYGYPANMRNQSMMPVYLENNPYIRYDYGGDGGTTEIALMVLDHWLYTQDAVRLHRYMPIVVNTIDFFWQHYPMRSSDGKMLIFPTQALETYWCAWEKAVPWHKPNASNCMSNDHPTIASLHVLLEKALQLPSEFTTAEQRQQWEAFQSILPPVPLIEEDGVVRVSPYSTFPSNSVLHNSETPELYSTHPFRYFTLGRNILGTKRDIGPSIQCLTNSSRTTCRNGLGNSGWNQGVMNAALLGLTDMAKKMVIQRATTPQAKGFRFPAFAPHMQDFEPSADHLANMNTALNWMLLQPADDELGSALLLGSWPCEWDVDFKLVAPMATTVEGVLTGGRLKWIRVTPPERNNAIHVVNCGPDPREMNEDMLLI